VSTTMEELQMSLTTAAVVQTSSLNALDQMSSESLLGGNDLTDSGNARLSCLTQPEMQFGISTTGVATISQQQSPTETFTPAMCMPPAELYNQKTEPVTISQLLSRKRGHSQLAESECHVATLPSIVESENHLSGMYLTTSESTATTETVPIKVENVETTSPVLMGHQMSTTTNSQTTQGLFAGGQPITTQALVVVAPSPGPKAPTTTADITYFQQNMTSTLSQLSDADLLSMINPCAFDNNYNTW